MREALQASRPAGVSSATGVRPNKTSTIYTKIYMWTLQLYGTSSEYCLRFITSCIEFVMYTLSQGWSTKAKSVDRALSCTLGSLFWGLPNMYPESLDCGLPGHLAVMRAAMMEPGVHTMSDELIPQLSCNIFLAFKWILMMKSGQNISHCTTAKLSIHVWNHDLIWWQNKIDTQNHFHKTTITSSWTLKYNENSHHNS